MKKLPVVLLVLCGASAVALAEGKLSGRLTDLNDQPVQDASVFITGPDGLEARVATDAAGQYAATVRTGGTYSVMFAYGNMRISSHVTIPEGGAATLDSLLQSGGEVIEIHGKRSPVQYARPQSDLLKIPQYSDRAALGDHWVRAWLLLDVDDRGVVNRVKFLKRPGYDLDDIAVKHAFGITFDPARDESGTPTRSYIVWPLEWPAMGWLQSRQVLMNRLPTFATGYTFDGRLVFDSLPRCAEAGPMSLSSLYPVLRDCSVPDLSRGDASEPWIARGADVPPPVVADAPVLDPKKLRADALEAARSNHRAAVISTAATGALLAGIVVTYWQYSKAADRVEADQTSHVALAPGRLAADQSRKSNWEYAAVGCALGSMVSGALSAHLWSKESELMLQPNAQGGSVAYAGRF